MALKKTEPVLAKDLFPQPVYQGQADSAGCCGRNHRGPGEQHWKENSDRRQTDVSYWRNKGNARWGVEKTYVGRRQLERSEDGRASWSNYGGFLKEFIRILKKGEE